MHHVVQINKYIFYYYKNVLQYGQVDYNNETFCDDETGLNSNMENCKWLKIVDPDHSVIMWLDCMENCIWLPHVFVCNSCLKKHSCDTR